MGLGQNFWFRFGSFFAAGFRSGWVSHLWVWKISPKNPKYFNFFPFGSKKYNRVGSKAMVKSMLRVRLGQGPSLIFWLYFESCIFRYKSLLFESLFCKFWLFKKMTFGLKNEKKSPISKCTQIPNLDCFSTRCSKMKFKSHFFNVIT